ncbi:MAG: 50S ribosomal protein L28 [Bacteroidales bacterium]|jgi:large subunit ribosomal protein L28|nr:50S ribosomal protein L28 [Bacteroidales bacterium]
MAKVCEITGRRRMKGNNVAHSKLRTKRDFSLNLRTKRFWSEEEQRFITLKVSCKGMRTIAKNGLEATIKKAQAKGYLNNLV